MRFHDTARNRVVQFTPRGDEVTLYVCGITPYDAAHLGHAFTYHVFDVLTRRLIDQGVRVRSVRNVTDVDDDILRVSRERHVDFRALAEQQITRFDEDMASIDILPVQASPRATQHVDEMVLLVERLIGNGSAYVREGWVYFRVASDAGYGRISHLARDDMVALSRERGADPDDPRKEDPLDFVLWQPSAPGEPAWSSPWGGGRPGWHIECTVLATRQLGDAVDIHGGGDDLIFPHHECEAAQAHGAGIEPYVRHWVHAAMVRYQGTKMSKSLGNLVFVRSLLQRVPAATVRLLLAAHHHRQSWEYDDALLRDADARRMRYEAALAADGSVPDDEAADHLARFRACIDDDLNTPAALRVADAAADALQTGQGGGTGADRVLAPMLGLLGVRPPRLGDPLALASGAPPR